MKMLDLSLAALFLAATACGDEQVEEPTLEEELCEHLAEGPAKPVTATAATVGAPDATADHTRIDVTLVPLAGMNGGTVTYSAPTAGDYAIALSKDVPLVVKKTSDGSVVAFEESLGQSTVCSELVARHVLGLLVGTYNLELGPTAETMVSFVVEEAAHAHE